MRLGKDFPSDFKEDKKSWDVGEMRADRLIRLTLARKLKETVSSKFDMGIALHDSDIARALNYIEMNCILKTSKPAVYRYRLQTCHRL
ncbi:unnamed protein product [Strongylus vulgaris]|uniref:Uncharacterized protein n=1 Tax=Strongylus vulgaris TaxID=40348 RepID=A0A3P7K8Y5_STRVU|nr:unnamed protein product [Strongylus vulgaris]